MNIHKIALVASVIGAIIAYFADDYVMVMINLFLTLINLLFTPTTPEEADK